jgi:hypothetical protein
MVQLADQISVPEMSLLCNVAEYFERNHIDYHPEILFRDVKVCFAFENQDTKILLISSTTVTDLSVCQINTLQNYMNIYSQNDWIHKH